MFNMHQKIEFASFLLVFQCIDEKQRRNYFYVCVIVYYILLIQIRIIFHKFLLEFKQFGKLGNFAT